MGGLLEVSYHGTSTTNCFVAYDGNGNVAALVNAADGTVVANYEYGPFGEAIRMTGPMAKVNPCRFSTKYDDGESDLLFYGYRFYRPSTGTWPNRDPMEEAGGVNLYLFVKNNPIDWFDPTGLKHCQYVEYTEVTTYELEFKGHFGFEIGASLDPVGIGLEGVGPSVGLIHCGCIDWRLVDVKIYNNFSQAGLILPSSWYWDRPGIEEGHRFVLVDSHDAAGWCHRIDKYDYVVTMKRKACTDSN